MPLIGAPADGSSTSSTTRGCCADPRAQFEEAGSGPLQFRRKDGRAVTTSYYEMPSEGFESPLEGARAWGESALAAQNRKQG